MDSRTLFNQVVSFLFFCFVQVFLFRYLTLYHLAFSYVYIGFILFLPLETNRMAVVSLGFALGLFMDMFYDTLGIHAASATLVAFLRGNLLDLLDSGAGNEPGSTMSPRKQGWNKFLAYCATLITVHSIALLSLDAIGMGFSVQLILAIFATALLNLILIMSFRLMV